MCSAFFILRKMFIKGKDLRIFNDGAEIGFAKECAVEISADTKEVADTGSGIWRKSKRRRNGWTVTCAFIIPVTDTMKAQLQRVGQTFELRMQTNDADSMSGNAICTGASIHGEEKGILTGQFRFIGSGEPKYGSIDFVITCEPFYILTDDNFFITTIE